MLRVIVLAFLFMSLEASDIAWYKSYTEASAAAKKAKKPMVVYLHSECGACKYLDMKVFNDKGIIAYMNDHFVAVSLSLKNDAPKNLQVAVAPVFHYLNYDGTPIQDDLIGATPASSFLNDLKTASKMSK